jgi:hypothetical protein
MSSDCQGTCSRAPGPPTTKQNDDEISDRFRQLDPSRYPATVTVADELPVPLQEEFAFGLRLIVAGLERLAESR